MLHEGRNIGKSTSSGSLKRAMDKIRVGLIGFGAGGQIFHAPVLSAVKGLELAMIRAARPEQVSRAKESILQQQ